MGRHRKEDEEERKEEEEEEDDDDEEEADGGFDGETTVGTDIAPLVGQVRLMNGQHENDERERERDDQQTRRRV